MSPHILVSGLINIETTLGIEQFPLEYFPVTYAFDKVHSTISGVGYNVAKALHTLGHPVTMATLIGTDHFGSWVIKEMEALGIDASGIERSMAETPASVIVYEGSGRRQIHVDLKTIQDSNYPADAFAAQLERCDLAVMCNINYNRALLPYAKAAAKVIATDVHCLADLDDDYNRDFMHAADILFLSDEGLHGRDPEWFIRELQQRYHNRIIVMGCGKRGALMYVAEDAQFYFAEAVDTRQIVNTIGAGDALFSAFIHGWVAHQNPYQALQAAIRFASWKIGSKGAADGFLDAQGLAALVEQTTV